MAFAFTRYADQGAVHWAQMETWSLYRYNAFQAACYSHALRALGDIAGKTVIDIGAGDGAFSSLIARKGANVTVVDNQDAGLTIAKKMFAERGLKAEFVKGEADSVPLPDGCADAVMCSELIEHLDDPRAFLREAKRLLKPGGTLVVTTPHRLGEIPMSHFHVHEFYPSELRDLVATEFRDVQVTESHHVFWFAFYGYRFPSLRRLQLGKYVINMMTLWFRCNPFLRDASKRGKRDYYSQLTLRAVK